MRLMPALLSSALLATPLFVHAQATAPQERPEVTAAAKAVQQKVVTWRRDFHQHPELSNREQRTAQKVAEHLRALGLKPKTGIAHHGVVAIIEGGKPGPRVAPVSSPCANVPSVPSASALVWPSAPPRWPSSRRARPPRRRCRRPCSGGGCW